MHRYAIRREDTHDYYLNGEWCEEPEWFNAQDAERVIRNLNVPFDTSIQRHDFDPQDSLS